MAQLPEVTVGHLVEGFELGQRLAVRPEDTPRNGRSGRQSQVTSERFGVNSGINRLDQFPVRKRQACRRRRKVVVLGVVARDVFRSDGAGINGFPLVAHHEHAGARQASGPITTVSANGKPIELELVLQAESLWNVGISLQRQRKTEDAIAAYQEALAFPPTTILFLNLADAYAFLNRDDDALENFRRCGESAVQRVRINVQDSG